MRKLVSSTISLIGCLMAQNVGIGTSTPGARLHVAEGEISMSNPNSYVGFLLALPGHHGYYGAWALYSISSGNLDPNPLLYAVRSTQRVGIGTTSPQAQFHTTGTVRFANYASGANGAILRTNNAGDLGITNFTGNATDVLLGNATFGSVNNLAWQLAGNSGTNPANHFIGTTDFKPLVFRVNNNQVMKIDEYGNVGIGTDPSSHRLLVGGPTLALGLTSMNDVYPLIVEMGRSSTELDLSIQSHVNQFAGGTQVGDVVFRALNPGKKIHFVAGGSPSTSLTVLSDRVGIGITTPAHRLHVNGSVYAERAYAAKPLVILAGLDCDVTISGSATQVILEFDDVNCVGSSLPAVTYVATPIEGQYLWITNLSGQNRLFHQHLLLNNTVTGFVYTSSQWRPVSVAQANDPNAWKLTGNTVSGTQWLGTLNNSPLPFRTNNQERMRITSAGNIGVGTNTPHASALLHLNSTTQGLLIPRMTTAQRNAISNPATALLIFNIDNGCFQFYDGSNWVSLSPCSVPCTSVGSIGTISGPTSVCAGSTGTFTIPSVPNATHYDWNLNGVVTTTTSTTFNVTFTASHPSPSTLTVTARNSCSQVTSASHTINVEPPQTPPDISGPNSVCPNTTFQLTIQGGTGNGPIQISTNPSGPWSNLSGTLPITHTISGGIASTTKYYVRRGPTSAGCPASGLDSVTVNVASVGVGGSYTPIIQAKIGDGLYPGGSSDPASLSYYTAGFTLCPNRYKRFILTNIPSGYTASFGLSNCVKTFSYQLGNGDFLLMPQSCPPSGVCNLNLELRGPCGDVLQYTYSIPCASGLWGSDIVSCSPGSPGFTLPPCETPPLSNPNAYDAFNGYLLYGGSCYECNCP